jgi:hypothetical protein
MFNKVVMIPNSRLLPVKPIARSTGGLRPWQCAGLGHVMRKVGGQALSGGLQGELECVKLVQGAMRRERHCGSAPELRARVV